MKDDRREGIDIHEEGAILVAVILPDRVEEEDPLAELASLADAAEVRVVGRLMQQREHPRARTYLGKGKVEELATMVKALSAKVVIFDNDLSPMQIKSLEEDLKCKVLDRSELILDIFANRAATKEARLQVEIAQLEYTAPRLRAMWSHLGQVTGGAPIGVGTRGPGEQQLEVDVSEMVPAVAWVDPVHLEQVMTNLIGNARKYGGPHVRVTTRVLDRRVEILVEDDGSGVPARFVPQLFDRYSRSQEARTSKQRGSGLGLYIVRDLLPANNATIDYEKAALGGAGFRISLPAA